MTGAGTRVLGIDLGEVRIGLALSDPLGLTAQPAGVLARKGATADVSAIRGLAGKHDVSRIVIGHPLLLSGERGTRAEACERFAAKLEAAIPGVAIELWDERLTTSEASRLLVGADVSRRRRREVVDAMAAALILQSWLDARGGGQPSE